MKNELLASAHTVLFLFIGAFTYSQDYDLIVTAKGDSIACRIDSITETHIYFEMKSQNNWAQTHIGLTDVSEYKRDAIFKKEFVYKTGTSIIESPRPDLPASIRDIQKNSVYAGIMGVYFFGSNSVPDVEEEDSYNSAVSIRMGYRYQSPGGLLLRAAPNFVFAGGDFNVFPAISIGYSF